MPRWWKYQSERETELQRGDRAFDRHVDDVDHQPAAVEGGQRRLQRGGPLGGVEGQHLVHPPRAGQTVGLLQYEGGAAGHDQNVVAECVAALEMDLLGGDVHPVDRPIDEVDAPVQLAGAGSDDVLDVGQPERHEQQARLVHVAVVLVDHRYRHLLGAEAAAQPVGGQRPAGAAAEDHNTTGHDSTERPAIPRGVGAKVPFDRGTVTAGPAAEASTRRSRSREPSNARRRRRTGLSWAWLAWQLIASS